MTPDEINSLAIRALNTAVKFIQDELGQTDGDVAGPFFQDMYTQVSCGTNEDIGRDLLVEYIKVELNHNEPLEVIQGSGLIPSTTDVKEE